MATIVWPRSALPPRHFSIDPAYRNLAGASNILGASQIAASDAGLWKATFAEFAVHQQGADRIKLWHALSALVEGRLNPVLMPVPVTGRRPLPAGITDLDIEYPVVVPHEDDALFDDDTGYVTTFIHIEVSANAARRSTQLSLVKTVAGDLEPGMRFSIGERLYQIKAIVSQTASAATIRLNFPLREAASSGDLLEFDNPVCRMRLTDDAALDLALEYGRYSFPSISLVEDL